MAAWRKLRSNRVCIQVPKYTQTKHWINELLGSCTRANVNDGLLNNRLVLLQQLFKLQEHQEGATKYYVFSVKKLNARWVLQKNVSVKTCLKDSFADWMFCVYIRCRFHPRWDAPGGQLLETSPTVPPHCSMYFCKRRGHLHQLEGFPVSAIEAAQYAPCPEYLSITFPCFYTVVANWNNQTLLNLRLSGSGGITRLLTSQTLVIAVSKPMPNAKAPTKMLET